MHQLLTRICAAIQCSVYGCFLSITLVNMFYQCEPSICKERKRNGRKDRRLDLLSVESTFFGGKQVKKETKGSCTLVKFFLQKMSATATVALHIKAILCDTTQVSFSNFSYIPQGSHEVNKSKQDETNYSLFTKMPTTVKVTFKSFGSLQNDPKELILI